MISKVKSPRGHTPGRGTETGVGAKNFSPLLGTWEDREKEFSPFLALDKMDTIQLSVDEQILKQFGEEKIKEYVNKMILVKRLEFFTDLISKSIDMPMFFWTLPVSGKLFVSR